MIHKELLRQIVMQQKEDLGRFPIGETVQRELLKEILPWLGDRRILILTGIRRSGKSTLLRQIMQHTPAYCYVNFEDERFLEFHAQDFEQLNEVLIEVYGNPTTYFFDEVQNVDRFETFVRKLQDQGKKVIITGSNAALLSRELGTRLTGRYKAFAVYPFSFTEYLAFKQIGVAKGSLYVAEKRVQIIQAFTEYLHDGGFPEYLKNKDREYIRTIYENILYRDIIARYAIRRQRVIRELLNLLTMSIASPITYNALRKSLGLANAITVKEHIAYLSNAYLVFELQKFAFSVRQQLSAPKKVYLIDPAFHQFSGLQFSANTGRVLENVVFIELQRQGKETYYHASKTECDFLIKTEGRITEAVQVCALLTEQNRGREVNGLREVMEKFSLNRGLILTQEQEEEVTLNEGKIQVLPVWKWLLQTAHAKFLQSA